MDIQSITSSLGVYTSAPAPTAQSQQVQQAQAVKQPEQREPLAVERTEEKPRPVVNTQGQETGKLINVTA